MAIGTLAPPHGGPGGRIRTLARLISARRELVLVVVLVGLALGFRVTMARTLPPWQSPDEPKHFEYIRLLVDKRAELLAERRMLNLSDASPQLQGEIISSLAWHRYWTYLGREQPAVLPKSFYEMWGGSSTQLHRPSLYYYLAALALLPWQGASVEGQLFVLRLFSALLSSLTVAIAYLALRKLAPGDRFVPAAGAALVAALPMHAFIGASVNNDNLVTLVGALLALAIGTALRHRSTPWALAWVWLLLVIGLATKRTFVGLAPLVILLTLFLILNLRSRALRIGVALAVTGVAGIAVFALTGQLDGVSGFKQLREMAMAYGLNEPDQVQRLLNVSLGSDYVRNLITGHLVLFFRSFWGILGWFNLPLSENTYAVLSVVTFACASGFLIRWGRAIYNRLCRVRSSSTFSATLASVYVVAILSMTMLALGERLAYLDPGHIPQGRYLFDAIVPAAAVYAIGARIFVPQHLARTAIPLAGVLLLLASLDYVVYTGAILPFYVFRPV